MSLASLASPSGQSPTAQSVSDKLTQGPIQQPEMQPAEVRENPDGAGGPDRSNLVDEQFH
jgi:hypothetical protein